MIRYNLGEQILALVELVDEAGNRVSGALVECFIKKPDDTELGPFSLTESSFLPGVYYRRFDSSVFDIEGDYLIKYTSVGFEPLLEHIFVKNYAAISDRFGIFRVEISAKTTDNQIIPDVMLSIISDSTPILKTLTNGNGKAIVYLSGGSYVINAYRAGYKFDSTFLLVQDDTSIEIIGEPIVYTPSPDPELCRIHVFAVDLNLEPASGVEVEVGYDVPKRIGDKLGVSRKKVYVTDATGYTFFDAPRNVSLIVRIEKAGILQAIKVPDAPFANIADLLKL